MLFSVGLCLTKHIQDIKIHVRLQITAEVKYIVRKVRKDLKTSKYIPIYQSLTTFPKIILVTN